MNITEKINQSEGPLLRNSSQKSKKPSRPAKIWIKLHKECSSINFQRKSTIFKLIFFTIIMLLINEYYKDSLVKEKEEENRIKGIKNYENNFLKNFQSLINISYDNISFLNEYRDKILKLFSKKLSKHVTSIDTLYIDYNLRFGNQLVLINKAIFYCEIIKCKKIFVSSWDQFFINNTIYDKQFNLSIEIAKNYEDYINKLSTYYYPYYEFLFIKPENRFPLFKNEILGNLPQVQTSPDDLYIHLRGGDIFTDPNSGIFYSQPPYCFYEAAINSKKYSNIYLLSIDHLNPVFNKLIRKHENLLYNIGNLKYDIAYLANAYNIVGSITSFITGIIKLNDKLKNFYEYDIYHITEKIFHMHSSLYGFKKNYVTYLMKPSKNYLKYMFIWKCTRKQLNLMLRDKCPKKFEKINPP